MMWGTDYGAGGWWMTIGSLTLSAVLIAAVVIGVVWLVRTQHSATPVGQGGSSASSILDERYARGEIDESELLRARQVLAARPPDARPKS